MNTQSVSLRQLLFLQFAEISGVSLILLPEDILRGTDGHDAPFAFLLVGVASLVINWGEMWALGSLPPADLFNRTWGRFLGTVLSGVFIIAMVLILISCWNQFLLLLGKIMLPLTPEWVVLVLGVMTTGVLGSAGIVGMARAVDLVVPLGLALLALLCVLAATQVEWWNLAPWYPETPGKDFGTIWYAVGFFAHGYVGTAILPNVRESLGTRQRMIVWGTVLSEGVTFIVIGLVVGVLGHQFSTKMDLAWYYILKSLQVGQFFSSVQIFFLPGWLALLYFKITIVAWMSATAIQRIAPIISTVPLTWAFLGLSAGLALAVPPLLRSLFSQVVVSGGVELVLVLLIFSGGVFRWRTVHRSSAAGVGEPSPDA